MTHETRHIALRSGGLGSGGGCGPTSANAQSAAPKDKGFTASKTTTADLGPEIEGMKGRQLRLCVLTIEPGGHIGLHSHNLVQGTDTVILENGTRAGELRRI
jgi:hypothetical protein